jgi:hypothetical protein
LVFDFCQAKNAATRVLFRMCRKSVRFWFIPNAPASRVLCGTGICRWNPRAGRMIARLD